MRILLVLASCMSVALAGVGVVTDEIEAEAQRLFDLHCGPGSDGGQDDTTLIYCKRSDDVIEESQQHEVQLDGSEEPQNQVVFVSLPRQHYKHDIVLTGGGGASPKTVIYVKPARNTHEIAVNDLREKQEAPQKPTLYFLKNNHDDGSSDPGSIRNRRQNSGNYVPKVSQSLGHPREAVPSSPKKTVYILRSIRPYA